MEMLNIVNYGPTLNGTDVYVNDILQFTELQNIISIIWTFQFKKKIFFPANLLESKVQCMLSHFSHV